MKLMDKMTKFDFWAWAVFTKLVGLVFNDYPARHRSQPAITARHRVTSA